MQALDSIEIFEKVVNCRTCLSEEISELLDLGLHPLANSLLDNPDQDEILVPLVLIRCESCTTVQLSVNVNPSLMFQTYLWVTGTTTTAKNHCNNLAKSLIAKSSKPNPRVLEIGSNDGTLLEALVENGAKEAIGVDPASNLQPTHLTGGIKLIEGFFSESLVTTYSQKIGKVDVIVARNVLSHVPSLNNVMQGIDKLIADDGMLVIEFHEASKILTELHYESIYHEHTFYHSIRSVQAALSQIGFNIFDISESPISGGSHVIYASRLYRAKTPELERAILSEEQLGVYNSNSWKVFAVRALDNLDQLRKLLTSESDSSWVAFGASARSSTLLNTIGSPAKNLQAIADNNPLKQGKYSPGLHIPIDNPKKIITCDVEKVFICAFNFEEEIVNFLKTELMWSGEVVLPLPSSIRRYSI